MKDKIKMLREDQDLLRLIFVAIFVFSLMAVLSPSKFFSVNNFNSMGYQVVELGIFSLAMMLAMLAGGIDLSIISISNLASITAAYILHYAKVKELTGVAVWGFILLAVLAAIIVGAVCGALNSFLISVIGLKPMLATLGTMNLFSGIAIVITQAKSVSKMPSQFLYFGNHTFLGIPIPFLVLCLIVILITTIINKTAFGFQVRFVGSNPKASFFTGIPNKKILFKTYMLTGMICSIAGLEVLMRNGSAKADYGSSYVFQAILCCILGATNPNGGYARISCLLLALVTMQFLSSGFSMLHLSGYYTDFANGLLLLIVLAVYFYSLVYKNKKVK